MADIAARLDRLPISRFHRRLLIVVGAAFFFDNHRDMTKLTI